MSNIEVDGEVYKEMKIRNLIINGKEQSGFVISADQLKGKSQIQVTIEAEPNIVISKEENNE